MSTDIDHGQAAGHEDSFRRSPSGSSGRKCRSSRPARTEPPPSRASRAKRPQRRRCDRDRREYGRGQNTRASTLRPIFSLPWPSLKLFVSLAAIGRRCQDQDGRAPSDSRRRDRASPWARARTGVDERRDTRSSPCSGPRRRMEAREHGDDGVRVVERHRLEPGFGQSRDLAAVRDATGDDRVELHIVHGIGLEQAAVRPQAILVLEAANRNRAVARGARGPPHPRPARVARASRCCYPPRRGRRPWRAGHRSSRRHRPSAWPRRRSRASASAPVRRRPRAVRRRP